MDWYHKTSYEWLDARRQYLTASDIPKLLPTTATGRPKSPAAVEEAIRSVWAAKQARVRDEDCESRGVMARGHLLEPFAIDEMNKTEYVKALDLSLHHWDDAMVHSTDNVSCSPDALSVAQSNFTASVDVDGSLVGATLMAEVKSYNATSHYEAGLVTPKLQLPERWQIATAFYVMPTIDIGLLVLYNPGARHPLFFRKYTRVELEVELTAIKEMAEMYWKKAADLDLEADTITSALGVSGCLSEDEICKMLIEQQAIECQGLNP